MPPTSVNREMLADQILLEQFIRDLEEEMQLWVRKHLPRSTEEALRTVEAFAASRAEPSKERVYKSEQGNYYQEDERCRGSLKT